MSNIDLFSIAPLNDNCTLKLINMANLCIECENSGIEIKTNTIYRQKKLGVWCTTIKKRHKANILKDEHIAILKHVPYFRKWFQNIKYYKHYPFTKTIKLCVEYETLYNKKIVQSTVYKSTSIGKWLSIRCKKYNKYNLTENEIIALCEINTFKIWLCLKKNYKGPTSEVNTSEPTTSEPTISEPTTSEPIASENTSNTDSTFNVDMFLNI